MQWGIELPFDKDYVTYVWFDALLNYITAIGWNSDDEKFNRYWPADYHLMAKDILTTHCVYWPTMLMACNIKLPKTIFAHGWWLLDDMKMSKSLGNTIKPLELADKFGSDALRYYLMRNMVLGQDASFTLDSFIDRYNADLANDFGNLVNRILILIDKNFNSCIPKPNEYDNDDLNLIAKCKEIPNQVIENYNDFKIHDALDLIMNLFRFLNKYLEIKAPWKLVKENEIGKQKAATTLYIAADILKIGAILISPVMPNKSKTINKYLGINKTKDLSFGKLTPETKITKPENLFPRIDEFN